jgi:hypothetical protein
MIVHGLAKPKKALGYDVAIKLPLFGQRRIFIRLSFYDVYRAVPVFLLRVPSFFETA